MAGNRKKFEVPEQKENGVRINKFLGDAGVCSRREADKFIEQGKVTIDGVVAEMGSRVFPGQKVTFNGKEMSNVLAIKIANFIFTYMVLIAGGTIILSINGFDFMTNFSAAISCLGNIGPGFNLVGPALNYSIYNDFSKLVCSFLMITGRLELYTVLVLFSRNYWNPNKLR